MLLRTVTILTLSLALVVGILALAERLGYAQAPASDTGSEPAATAPVPAAPAVAPTVAPVDPVPPSSVAAPDAPAPAAVVTAPATPPDAPAANTAAPAQSPTVVTSPMPPVKPEEKVAKSGPPARELFGAKKLPSIGHAAAIGYYPRGCLQGGVELPVNGPTWQVMRLSRNRNWGHPSLVSFLEKFAPLAAKRTGWNGVLIGDMAQPRGGPAVSDHMSHQTGLDVDIWFMPMPDHQLSKSERESISAINVVADDWRNVNPKFWTPQHIAFIKAAAEQPEVERVLVNAAIKKELCRVEGVGDKGWMSKVRPWYGHHDHIHVRLRCPDDSPNCRKQPPTPTSDGCADADLKFWFTKALVPRKPSTAPGRQLTMADLPPACKSVLSAPAVAASR